MLSLPPIHGRFPVGITTFVTPVRPARSVGKAILKNPNNSLPNVMVHALQLEEVAFTAYYPADTSSSPSKGIDWLFRPLGDSLLGLSSYMGVSTWLLWPAVYLFGSLLKIPAYPNAPLLHPERAQGSLDKQWPLVIFSHGLGGSRTTYSQYCSRLAASGKVVLALEHRDGTGMACMPRSWGADGKQTYRSIVYLKETDIYWEDGKGPEDYPKPWRGEQLMFRHHEINIMYEAFQDFVRKDLDVLESIDGSQFDKASWSSLSSAGNTIIRYNEDVFLIGHSFGGATSLSLLATKPSDYTRIPISKVIVLDPWLDPLPSPGPAPYVATGLSNNGLAPAKASGQQILNGASRIEDNDPSLPLPFGGIPRVLVINSEAFTLWEDHFARLQEVMAIWEPQGRRITTLIGSEHISFSDFPVLPILRKNHDIPIFDNIVKLSLAFLENRFDDALKGEVPTTDMDIRIIGTKPNGKQKKKLAGEVGHVVVS